MKDMFYVHMDTINNSVLSKGITASDFCDALKHTPNNLLLLSDYNDYGEYESHTGLRVVRNDKVDEFLKFANKRNDGNLKWIDFADLQLIKQLTPVEISELLYFGHMNNHLHSPFFYKLQNNYVFLNVNDQINKIYYRYMDVFYQVLALKVKKNLEYVLTAKQRGFFKKYQQVESIDIEIIKSLKYWLQEGIVFNFNNIKKYENRYEIPIYLVEDKLRKIEDIHYTKELLVANLKYSVNSSNWQIDFIK